MYTHSRSAGCSLFESAAYHLDPVTQYALRKGHYGGGISQKKSTTQTPHHNQGAHAGGKTKRKEKEAPATKRKKKVVHSTATKTGGSLSEKSQKRLQQPAMKRPKLHFAGGASTSDLQESNSHDTVGSKKSQIQADVSENQHGSGKNSPDDTSQTPAGCSSGTSHGSSPSSDLQSAKNTNTMSLGSRKRRTASSAPSTSEDETSASARNKKKSRKKKKSPQRMEQTPSSENNATTNPAISQLVSHPDFMNNFVSCLLAKMTDADGASPILAAALSNLSAQTRGEPILSKKALKKEKKQK